MRNNGDINANAERRLKWNELAIRIEHYKYYLGRALHVTAFFYAITGGVLGFYLKDLGKDPVEAAKYHQDYHLEYFRLLPILIGSVLGGVLIHGARLQERAVDSMEHIRNELRERLGLDVEELYDAHLLNILLRLLGYIYFFVASLLVLVPLLTLSPSSKYFSVTAILFLLAGCLLAVFARGINNRLRERRTYRMLSKLRTWKPKRAV